MTLLRLQALITLLLATVLLSPASIVAQEVPELQITSSHYILLDAETGEVYAQRNADKEVAIASITKVFTAVQAVNMAPLDTLITTKASDLQSAEATTMGFGPGETYTLEDLIHGMLLPSGNDAAYAIARSLGYQKGDTDEQAVDRFMALVNQRVENMGLKHTHLLNPDGWGVPGHYSSASDVAAFMRYAIEYPFLVDVMGTRSYTTSNRLLTVTNSNKLLNSYGALVAGKTGYDDDAGWCLVTLAESRNTRMVAVTLDGVAPDDWYDDNRVLLDYGFRRKPEIAASGDQFNGDVVEFVDPDLAQLAKSGKPGAAISGSAAVTVQFDSPQLSGNISPANGLSTSINPSQTTTWLAFVAAFALVGASGALHWRGSGGTVTRGDGTRVDFRRSRS
jgi:D-alanyl-D-alanine carboxypeptidase (penicillin-binding protein 5/6)